MSESPPWGLKQNTKPLPPSCVSWTLSFFFMFDHSINVEWNHYFNLHFFLLEKSNIFQCWLLFALFMQHQGLYHPGIWPSYTHQPGRDRIESQKTQVSSHKNSRRKHEWAFINWLRYGEVLHKHKKRKSQSKGGKTLLWKRLQWLHVTKQ